MDYPFSSRLVLFPLCFPTASAKGEGLSLIPRGQLPRNVGVEIKNGSSTLKSAIFLMAMALWHCYQDKITLPAKVGGKIKIEGITGTTLCYMRSGNHSAKPHYWSKPGANAYGPKERRRTPRKTLLQQQVPHALSVPILWSLSVVYPDQKRRGSPPRTPTASSRLLQGLNLPAMNQLCHCKGILLQLDEMGQLGRRIWGNG